MKIFKLSDKDVGKNRFLRIMKATVLALFLFTGACFGAKTYSQATLFSFEIKNETVGSVIRHMEENSEFIFFYMNDAFDTNRKVNVRVNDMSVDKVLEQLLEGTDNTYKITDRQVTIVKKEKEDIAIPLLQQPSTRRITGTITDNTGEPIIGANVVEKGTTNGVSTDIDGNFSLNVNSDHVELIVSYIGYSTQVLTAKAGTPLIVKMSEDLALIDEVVVIGYGVQKKRDVTGSVTSISSETLLQVPAQTNIINNLQGRVAGLDISTTGNSPGSIGQIRLRGERSFATSAGNADATNAPLFVLDGIPFINGTLNDINPNDILSIEVLKDASASAIYGSRAAGGVILITTKRGKSGPTVVNFNTTTGVSHAIGYYDLMNAQQYIAFKQETMAGNSLSPGNTAYPITVAEQEGINNGTDTDWSRLVLRRGFVTDNNLRISGGTDNTQYSVGLGYLRDKGIQYGQGFERGNFVINIDQTIGRIFKFGLTSNNNLSYTDNVGDFAASSFSPLLSPYNEDGTINLRPATGTLGYLTALNPLTLRDSNIQAVTRRINSNSFVYGEANIIDGLKYRLNASLSYNQSQGNKYSPVNTLVNTNTTQDQSTASISNSENYVWVFENILTYDKTFAEKHHITFTGLFSAEKSHSQGSGLNATGIPADYLQSYNLYLANSINVSNSNFSYAQRGMLSYMARVFYSFNDKYMLTATVRRDGSSVLGPGSQYFTYPAFSFGWNIDRENFMEPVSWVSSLKLRAGYGVTANQNISPYQILGNLSAVAYNFGTNFEDGYLVTTLPNMDLKFEHTNNINLGIDFGLFKNRITGSFDVYTQRTYDILQVQSLPLSNGTASTTVNAGNSRGKGLEFNINSHNLVGSFKWSTDFNISFQRSWITALHDELQQDIGNGWFVGHPFNVIFDYKKTGIWQASEVEEAAKYNALPGWIKVEDVDNNGKIDAEDRQILGSYEPDYIAGLTNRFSYKGFEFTAVAFARMGQKVSVNYLSDMNGFFNIGRVNQYNLNYWTPDNPTNDFPRPDAARSPLYGTTVQYQDGSFIKMRSLNLGYDLTESILKNGPFKSLKLSVIVNNPFTIYAPLVRKGLAIDPESNRRGGQGGGASGFSSNALGRALTIGLNLQQARIWSIGINASF